jgi:hypothetical protein
MKAGSPILASSSSHFSAEDVAKPVYVLNAGVNGAPLSTTIVSILGTASALLAAPAATAVTNTSVTIGFDDTTSIQDAIAAVDKTGGGTVYIPAGFYRIAGAGGLTLEHSHIRLTGDGPNSILFESDLEYYPTTQTLAGGWSPHRLISVGISQGIVADVEIDHLQVQSNGDNWIQHSLGQSLIETSPTSDFEIDNFSLHDVTFTSLNFGLYSNGGRLTSFDISNNVMTEVAKEAIYLAGTPSSGIVSNNQISTDIYPSISNIGIEIKNGNNLQISANVIKGSFYTCIGSNTFPENYITVEHNQCSFSNSSNVADGIAFSAITIVGNTVQNGNGGAAISVVALPADPTNGPAGITVSNNSLIDNASVGGIIELSNVQGDNTVTYNTIRTIVKMPGEALTISTMSASILACYGNTAVNYPLGDASCQW